MTLITLGTQLPPALIWILIALLGACVGYGVMIGRQSLIQASSLKDTVSLSSLGDYLGQVVTVRGRATRVVEDCDDPRVPSDWLWYVERTDVYRAGAGRSPNWTRGGTYTQGLDFDLEDRTGSVLIRNDATEVHGTKSQTVGKDWLAAGTGDKRWVCTYLSSETEITVVGQVRRLRAGGYSIVKDDSAGLLLSARSPSQQSNRESLKGWLGVLVGPLIWLVILLIAISRA